MFVILNKRKNSKCKIKIFSLLNLILKSQLQLLLLLLLYASIYTDLLVDLISFSLKKKPNIHVRVKVCLFIVCYKGCYSPLIDYNSNTNSYFVFIL